MTRGKMYFLDGPLAGKFEEVPDTYKIVEYPVQPTLFDDPVEHITYEAVSYSTAGPGIPLIYMRLSLGSGETE